MRQRALHTVTDEPLAGPNLDAAVVEANRAELEVAAVARATSVPSTPVFVDITGRRARWLRALAVVACLLVLAYLGVLAAGVFGSSVDLSTAVPHASASASASTS